MLARIKGPMNIRGIATAISAMELICTVRSRRRRSPKTRLSLGSCVSELLRIDVGLYRANRQKHWNLLPRDVLGMGARAARAGFVARPFFDRINQEAGIAQRFHVRLDGLMKGPRIRPRIGAWSRNDRRFARNQ